jgi:predicted anti-sigma-YlaC factor YlaD
MTCLNLEQLYSYVEGELSDSEKKNFEAHLESCPKCRDAVEERRLLIRAVETLPQLEVPADFAHKVMSRIAPARVKIFGWLGAAAAFLATSAIMVTAVALLTGRSLSPLVLGMSRFLWQNINDMAFSLAKITKSLLLALKILAQISREIFEGFKILTSFISLEAQVVLVGIAFIFILTGGFLWSRKSSMEKNHEK